jgi:hypothetical protein
VEGSSGFYHERRASNIPSQNSQQLVFCSFLFQRPLEHHERK